ncbi:sugar ABC transporter ATP-binding protein [Labrys wisconsinensis]|uniref:Ribose transport system ATP-binding protein n=1 Tax=Labrys wisconsinensis TaxID=425677 RepID=A0ABU0J9K0_9HYPH|nr:sugar ABC transporter ATP-binding protein [Labrys wisconsinensis]MDQ0470943.1 ribose transport system ATP-binding protein [Labrys wisconsinensis]
MTTSMIDIAGVSRSFAGTQALDRVSLAVAAGSVHAVTGENGAGKSTLMKILAGVVRADAGEVRLSGQRVDFHAPADAVRAGVSTVFQEFTLIPNLTVAESIFLGREPRGRWGGVDARALREGARAALARLGCALDPDGLVRHLTVAEQQMVEIAKGISADARVFIFDEPTAALNTADVDKLRRVILGLRAAGKTILYISHRLREIFDMCDTVTVLKDGRHVATRSTAAIDEHGLVALMVGRELSDFYPGRGREPGPPCLAVEALVAGAQGRPVGFTLARGEIVGLAGLEGQGQRDIARAIAGIIPRRSGRIAKFDRRGGAVDLPADASVAAALAQGIGFVPEDRKGEGLFLDLGIAENVALGVQTGRPFWARAPDTRAAIESMMRRMNVRARSTQVLVGALSGGNQQKVLIGRWLSSGADLLVVEEPTRGVDVGAKSEVYKLLRGFTRDGGAVLVLSREMPELIGLCDRLLVVHGGGVVAEMPAAEATEHRILHAAIGSRQAA